MHLLLIEDDSGIITPLTAYLKQAGHTVSVCTNGLKALESFSEEKPQLVILDINLPGKNGIEICREIRTSSKVPIIILSARESEDDKVQLLELGADDYVAKPFSPRELVARITAVAKRAEEKKDAKNTKTLTLGTVEIDSKNHIALLSGEEIKLTKTEFAILEYLLKNSKGVIKRDSLMKDIIGYDNYLYDRTIDTHIKNLRKKLEGAIEIETIRGVGYRVR
ncbi:response regulator transcription factor [Candidatus Gracilibacteria bacterium]|nr:response regulator transcription factor [Candidatus Gracilibacteria bacterium]